jgi:hypothetical protein
MRIGFSVRDELGERLRHEVARQRRPVSWVICDAVEAYLTGSLVGVVPERYKDNGGSGASSGTPNRSRQARA